jgi:hypothetical protein
MAGTTCFRGCGTAIKFDKSRVSQSGKMIPLEMNGEPHQCPHNKYNQIQQQQAPSPLVVSPIPEVTEDINPARYQNADQSTKDTVQMLRETKEEYFRKKEEKYDRNVEEYKQWQGEMKDIAVQTLTQITRIYTLLQQEFQPDPTIQSYKVKRQANDAFDKIEETIDQTVRDDDSLGLSEENISHPQYPEDEDMEAQGSGGLSAR